MKQLHLLALVVVLSASTLADAATYTVSNLADSGSGSLRAAVIAANANPGADSIVFQPGLNGSIQLATAMSISDPVTLFGPGPGLLTLRAAPNQRIFSLERPGLPRGNSVIAGLTLANGQAAEGGAILVTDENLTLRNVILRENRAVNRGGAIRMDRGDLTLEDVDFDGNEAVGSTSSSDNGGALYFNGGNLVMKRGLIKNNRALYGGALYITGVDARIEDSLFMNNAARHTAGAIHAGSQAPPLHITRSAFVGNTCNEAIGAAIHYSGSTSAGATAAVIENTTFSGNSTPHSGGRGILALLAGRMQLRNSTLANNRTATGTTASTTDGGAVWVGSNATLDIESTLFSQNSHGNSAPPRWIDLSPSSAPTRTINLAHSLLHSSPASGVINGSNTDNQFDIDAQLGPLVVEGQGFVPVHPIPATSAAIDRGSNPANLGTDQRGVGYPRAVDRIACRSHLLARADVGAYEYRTDTIFCNGFQP